MNESYVKELIESHDKSVEKQIFSYYNLLNNDNNIPEVVRNAANGIFNDGEVEEEYELIYDSLKSLFNFYVMRLILEKKIESNKAITASDVS